MKGRKPALKVVAGSDMAPPVDQPTPAWLPPMAALEWRRIAPGLASRGLLSDDTAGTIESYCIAQGQVRQFSEILARDGALIETDAGPTPHPANRLLLAVQREARLLAGELGITPHRFISSKKKDDDDLSDLDL